jgi:glycosyltransferase involved in cell wall biosynthesis
MSNNKTLIIVENLPLPFDKRVWNQATALKDAGYEVSIICPKMHNQRKSREVINGINIYRHPLPIQGEDTWGYVAEYLIATCWQFFLTLKVWHRHGFDVIHGCNPPDTLFVLGRICKLFGKKFIFDHHDINPELFEAKFARKSGFLYQLVCWLEKQTFKTADVSIATNNSYKEIAISRGGMPADKVHVVRSGPNLEQMKLSKPTAKLKKGKKYLVGYVGIIGKQEGMHYLLEAINYIKHTLNRHDIHYAIIGSGTELKQLKKTAKDLGLDNKDVTFTGKVDDETLLQYLNSCDVCVNPDTYNPMNDKSTMNKIMEYMALKKPIVQFDMTEGRFSAKQASLYANPNDSLDFGDKIIELINDPQKREEMGEIGYNRIRKELHWGVEAPKLIKAYEAALSS